VLAVFLIAFGGRMAIAAPWDDACSLLTQAQVSAALGIPVNPGVHVSPAFLKTCTWNAASDVTKGARSLTLMLVGLDVYEAGKLRGLGRAELSVTPITGVGEEAYYLAQGNEVTLVIKKGNVALKAIVNGDVLTPRKQAIEKLLAEQAVPRL
jgi:hypothetical protein